MVAELKAVPLAQGHEEIFYPGEIEARNEARHRSEGLVLPPDTIRDLEKVAAECGLPPPTAADRGDLAGEAELAAAGRPMRGAVALEDHVPGERGGLAVVAGQGVRLGGADRPAVALADEGDHRPGRELEPAVIAVRSGRTAPWVSQSASRASTTSLRCSSSGVQDRSPRQRPARAQPTQRAGTEAERRGSGRAWSNNHAACQ